MGECNGCGQCCDPIGMTPDMYRSVFELDLSEWAETQRSEIEWYRAHMTEIGRDEDLVYLRCDRFDPESRQCLAYDERPLMCSNYPWYDREPSSTFVLDPMCSFNEDVGRKRLPFTVIPHEEVPCG